MSVTCYHREKLYFNEPTADVRCASCGAIFSRVDVPEVERFVEGFKREADYQQKRWADDDKKKVDGTQWFGLVVHLINKVVRDDHEPDDKRTPRDRRLHRIIAAAAACFNWHKAEKVGQIAYPYQSRAHPVDTDPSPAPPSQPPPGPDPEAGPGDLWSTP